MRTLVLGILLACSSFAFGQTVNFKLTGEGTFVCSETEKPFVVIPFENKKAGAIYKEIDKAVTAIYQKDPEFKIVDVQPGTLLAFSSLDTESVKVRGFANKADFAFNYTISFLFKDNKLRIDAPTIDRFVTVNNGGDQTFGKWLQMQGIIVKNNVIKPKQVKDFNNAINSIVNRILQYQEAEEESW